MPRQPKKPSFKGEIRAAVKRHYGLPQQKQASAKEQVRLLGRIVGGSLGRLGLRGKELAEARRLAIQNRIAMHALDEFGLKSKISRELKQLAFDVVKTSSKKAWGKNLGVLEQLERVLPDINAIRDDELVIYLEDLARDTHLKLQKLLGEKQFTRLKRLYSSALRYERWAKDPRRN